MATKRNERKNKRVILSFEPEPDVNEIVMKARQAGLSLPDIFNQLVRQGGATVIRSLAKKKIEDLQSFEQPDLSLDGLALSA